VRESFVLVDVHFGADDDRDAREDGGQPSVQARRQKKRVHDLRPGLAQVALNAGDIAEPSNAWREPEDRHRRAGLADFFANRTRFVDAADHRLESRWQMTDQVEDHLLRPADHECVCEIDDANAAARHAAWVR